MSKDLVIITGASSGIGEAIARAFSAVGHPLLLIARRVDKLKALNLPDTLCVGVDVCDKISMQKSIDNAIEKYGSVGCLVNNAGVMSFGNVGKQSSKEWQAMIETNVIGMINGIECVVNAMKKQRMGTIINISSIAGYKTLQNAAVYCASKYAVNAFSETLRSELAEYNVRVIVIAPGGVKTDLHTHMEDKQMMNDYKKWIQSIHLLEPSELADMVVHSYKLPQHVCLRQVIIAPTNQTI